ncbi:hypothetical protein BG006_002055 [Podila minutissima]|uniref:ABC transporter domain-containing protein n=1 Tax=Podila minutissima TaxID=64525 RepID=A0A9P5VNW1_9FUNG|nr:hypothetical protein BG006_002055 [Podila minutissima]
MFRKKKPQAVPSTNSQSHLSIPMQPVDGTKDVEAIEFEPLPTPFDFSGMKPTARYQTRALARRALSFHARQRITNGICLIIWPVLMALLNYFLAAFIAGEDSVKQGIFRMCVNEANPQRSRFVTFGKHNLSPEEAAHGFNASYYPKTNKLGGFYTYPEPCVRWFGESHPNQPPYMNGTGNGVDTYFAPADFNWLNKAELEREYTDSQPKDDWKNPYKTSPAIFKYESVNMTVYYSVANAELAKTLGAPPNVTRMIFSESWPPTNTSVIYSNSTKSPAAGGSGLFGAIPVRYVKGETYVGPGNRSYPEIPSYKDYKASYTSMPNFALTDDIDESSRNMRDNRRHTSNGNGMGSVAFEALDLSGAGSIKATLQMGVFEYESGIGQMVMISQLSNAMVKIKYAGKYILSQGIRALPHEYDLAQDNGYNVNKASATIFPFAFSFLLPTFVSILVQEKENRLRVMMAMNGLKSSAYYLAHYVEFMTMQLILTLIFTGALAAMKITVMGRTNTWLLILLFVLWAHVQVCFAFVIASVFSRTRRAAVAVNFFVALSAILTVISDYIFDDGIPIAWLINPAFAFFYIISTAVMRASMVNMTYPLTFADFTSGSRLHWAMTILVVESVVFLLLALYLDAVSPSEYGVTRPWHFFITDLFKSRGHRRDPESSLRASGSPLEESSSIEGGDADVQEELERVRTVYDPEQTPLILDNLHHRYAGKITPALRGISFGVKKNTVLGLLGPNGAGKSTMIHLLTGLYKPTSGTAHVAGANIHDQMGLVHLRTGVCPQHDILWGDLTVDDHLLFYSRLRGVPPALEQQAVSHAIASVCLTKFRDRQVKTLSGGERRRVSIAIAMLGDNRVIFLDEPTTGLDPAVRRIIWDIVNRVKVDRTVILTTHSMEEADVLSDRIAIMTSGQLRCIGTSLHLKELYGSGFRLSVTSKPGRLQEACQSIEEKVLGSRPFKRTDKFTNATVFDFDIGQASNEAGVSKGELSSIFKSLSQKEQFPDVEDWGIGQTTLEDVFVRIVTDADASLRVPTVLQGGQLQMV